jgi:hypothetical protein
VTPFQWISLADEVDALIAQAEKKDIMTGPTLFLQTNPFDNVHHLSGDMTGSVNYSFPSFDF